MSDFATRIGKNEEVKIQYNPPWFWKVRKNKAATRKEVRAGPRIMSRKDEAEILRAQSEILQGRNDASEDASNGDTLVQARRVWTNHLAQEQEEEDALNRLKEEDLKEDWPPPLEWGEDADVAEVR